MDSYIVGMNLISTSEAAQRKDTSPHVVLRAAKREEIDAVKVGGTNLIKDNKKFKSWKRSERHVKAAQTRWAKKKK
jgi:hypothetical protein